MILSFYLPAMVAIVLMALVTCVVDQKRAGENAGERAKAKHVFFHLF